MTAQAQDPQDRDLLALAAEVRKYDWVRIDSIWERFRTRYGLHLRRDTGLDAEHFLVEAFATARAEGLLRVLAYELVREGLVTAAFPNQLVNVVGPSTGVLHAFQNGTFHPVDAVLAATDMLTACGHVCRIDIMKEQRGTGVQVSAWLVATAAHVIWDLIARREDGSPVLRGDGSLQAAKGSAGKLTLTFEDHVAYLADRGARVRKRLEGEAASLPRDWLAWGSPPTDMERARALFDVSNIDGISAKGPWDLALIQMAVPRLRPRRELLTTEPPSGTFQIHILHHPHGIRPNGEPLVWSIGRVDRQLGDPAVVRYLHDANTLPGSSGAPVFDSGWQIVALHQGGERELQRAEEADGVPEGNRNRAVPVRHWCDRVDVIERSAIQHVPYLTMLTNSTDLDPNPYPVIGRRETQQRVWRAMQKDATAAQRVLIIRGEPGTGLRFTKRLVREMVTPADDVVVALDVANALEDTAAGFAQRIIGTLAAQLPLVDADGPPLNALPRTIRSDLVPALGASLEQLTGARATWLVLEGFDAPGAEILSVLKDLVFDLIGSLEEHPNLRLVLTGWQETPAGYKESVETLLPPTLKDVVGSLLPPGHTERERAQKARSVGKLIGIPADEALSGYPRAHELHAALRPFIQPQVSNAGGS